MRWVRRSALATCVGLTVGLLTIPTQAAPGDLDTSFGTGGKVITDFGPGSNSARAVAIQANGKIVVVGDSGSFDFALARYNADGSLDTTFGTGGKVTTAIGIFDVAFAVALQADGKIVAAGGTAPGGFCCQFALARYDANGALDPTFDGDGKVTTIFGGMTQAFAIAIQADGKIIAAGSTFSPFFDGFAFARYNSDGSLDTSFGTGGKVTTDFGGVDGASGLAIQADGKIVASGSGGPSHDFLLARYNSDGSLDTSFGTGGKVTTDFGGFDGASGVAIQADSKIVVSGRGGFFSRFALARYNTDGSLDATFDGDGKVTTVFFGESIESAAGLAIQTNGKIVAVGTVFSSFDPSFALARYNADGSLDTSFGTGGRVTTDFGNPSDVGVLCPPARKDCSEDNALDVAIQADGKIVAVGGAGACIPSCRFAVARYFGDPITVVLQVQIDIKPGSDPNSVSLRDQGRLPVAILGSVSFSPTQVDPSTIRIGSVGVASRGSLTGPTLAYSFEDVTTDGFTDAVAFFEVQALVAMGVLSEATVSLTLEAQLFDSTLIHGTDTINVVP